MKKILSIIFILLFSVACASKQDSSALSKKDYINTFTSYNKEFSELKLDLLQKDLDTVKIDKAIIIIDKMIDLKAPVFLNRKEKSLDKTLTLYKQQFETIKNAKDINQRNKELKRLDEITMELSASYNRLSK